MGNNKRGTIAAVMVGFAVLASACSTSTTGAPSGAATTGSSAEASSPRTAVSSGSRSVGTTAPITVVDPVGDPSSRSNAPTGTSVTTAPSTTVAPSKTTTSTTASTMTSTKTPATTSTKTPATTSTKTPTTASTTTPTTAATTTTPAVVPATVTASPAFGTETVGPLQPLTVSAANGTITALRVLAEDGSNIAGAFSADKTSWTSDQRLRYGGSYTASGTATGKAGSKPTAISGTWTVYSVSDTVSTFISPDEDATVGVAAPVIVRFGYHATAEQKAEIQRHAVIISTPKVEGAWGWFTHDGEKYASLDFRPKSFWPAGTKVTVKVDLLGVPFADGLYGGRKVTTRNFTVGRNRVTYADPKSHLLTVKESGKVVAQYPDSMGRGDDVGDKRLVTRSGIHIVLSKQKDVLMSNPAYGYKDLPEKWAVRISNNGEFIHQNLASVKSQGKANVSHGCINLNDVNAEAYFNQAIYGDPVVVTGTSVKLGPLDGDYYGWALSWDDWKSHSAL